MLSSVVRLNLISESLSPLRPAGGVHRAHPAAGAQPVRRAVTAAALPRSGQDRAGGTVALRGGALDWGHGNCGPGGGKLDIIEPQPRRTDSEACGSVATSESRHPGTVTP